MKIAIIILLFCVVGYSIAFNRYELWCYHICQTSSLCSNSLHLPCFTYFDFQTALNKTNIRTLDTENELLKQCVDIYLNPATNEHERCRRAGFDCGPVNKAWASMLTGELSGKLPIDTVDTTECDLQWSDLKPEAIAFVGLMVCLLLLVLFMIIRYIFKLLFLTQNSGRV